MCPLLECRYLSLSSLSLPWCLIFGRSEIIIIALTCPLSFEHTKVLCTSTKEVGGQQAGFSLSPFLPLLPLWNTGSRPNSLADAPASQPFTARSLVGEASTAFFFFFFSLISSEKSVRVQYEYSSSLASVFLSFFLSFPFYCCCCYIFFHSKER